MPQLDFLAYFSQVFWLVLLFSIYYIVLVQFILPRIKTIFDVRHSFQVNASRLSQNETSTSNSNHTLKFPTQDVVQLLNQSTFQIVGATASNSITIYKSIHNQTIRYLTNFKKIKVISII